MARECLFCGNPANTVEDALPLWLADLLTPPSGTRTYHQMPGGVYWESSVFRARTRRVCKTCNEGWMSDLEQKAKPLLLPMIFHTSKMVLATRADKTSLSTWAFKTAITLDFAKPGQTSRIPLAHCRSLGTYRRPPQDVSVWLGHLPTPPISDKKVVLWQRSTFRQAQGAALEEFPLQLYFVAFFIGNAVFEVFGRFGGRGLAIRLNGPTASRTRSLPLWPIHEGDVEWPPPLSHSPKSLSAFLDAGPGLAG